MWLSWSIYRTQLWRFVLNGSFFTLLKRLYANARLLLRNEKEVYHLSSLLFISILWIEIRLLFFLFSVMDHCHDSPCQNNGTCHNNSKNYTCTCPAEFTGQNCEGVSSSNLYLSEICQYWITRWCKPFIHLMQQFSYILTIISWLLKVRDHCQSSPANVCLFRTFLYVNYVNSGGLHDIKVYFNYLLIFIVTFCTIISYLFAVRNHCQNRPCENNGTCHNLPDNYTCACPAGSSGLNCEGMPYIQGTWFEI